MEASMENDYEFCATKTCEYELEDTRTMNYQFLQSYDFTDEEIVELCSQTVKSINSIRQRDIDSIKAYLTNFKDVRPYIIENLEYFSQALLIDNSMIHDSYIVRIHVKNKSEKSRFNRANYNYTAKEIEILDQKKAGSQPSIRPAPCLCSSFVHYLQFLRNALYAFLASYTSALLESSYGECMLCSATPLSITSMP